MYEGFIREITQERTFQTLIREMTGHASDERILSRCHGQNDDHYLLTQTAVIQVIASTTGRDTTINCTRLPLSHIQSAYESMSVKDMELEPYIRDREAACLVPDYSIEINGIETNFIIRVNVGIPDVPDHQYRLFKQARHFANKLNSLLAGKVE